MIVQPFLVHVNINNHILLPPLKTDKVLLMQDSIILNITTSNCHMSKSSIKPRIAIEIQQQLKTTTHILIIYTPQNFIIAMSMQKRSHNSKPKFWTILIVLKRPTKRIHNQNNTSSSIGTRKEHTTYCSSANQHMFAGRMFKKPQS